MNDLFKILLESTAGNSLNNLAMLVFRILLAVELFRVHGLKKFRGDNGQPEEVPNPFHFPKAINGGIAAFADTVAPLLVILGLFTRLAILPTIGVTAVGYFWIHRNDPAERRDIPYMYTLCFLLLFIIGPGTLSLDHYLLNMLTK